MSKLLNWIHSFLKGRKQGVIINDFKSTWANVVSGVQQGSVLGPVFFLIYINDLSQMLSNPCLLFADDTKTYSHIKNEYDIYQLQQDIDKLLR